MPYLMSILQLNSTYIIAESLSIKEGKSLEDILEMEFIPPMTPADILEFLRVVGLLDL